MHRIDMKICVTLWLLFLLAIAAYVRIAGIETWNVSTDDTYIQALATVPAPQPPFDYAAGSFQWIKAAFLPRESMLDIIGTTPVSGHPAFYYLLLHGVMQISSDPLALRMLSLIPALLSILLAFLIGRQTSGVLSGLVAATLLAFSDIHIVISQEIRSYSLFVFLLLVMCFSILRHCETRKRNWLLAYGASAFLALFTHYSAALLIAAIGTVGMWRQYKTAGFKPHLLANRNFLLWAAFHALLAGLYLWQHLTFLAAADLVTPEDWWSVPFIGRLALCMLIIIQVPGRLFFADSTLFFMLPSFLFAFGVYALWRDRKYEFMWVSAGVVLATALLLALKIHPHYAVRHFAHLFPVLLIACAYPFSQAVAKDGVKTAAAFTALFLVFCGYNLFGPGGNGLNPDNYRENIYAHYDRKYQVKKEDWEAFKPALEKSVGASDIVMTDQLQWLMFDRERRDNRQPFSDAFAKQFYVCQDIIRLYPGNPLFARCMDNVRKAHPQAKRVWVILFGRQQQSIQYQGKTVKFPQLAALEKSALTKIAFPTVSAYAIPLNYRYLGEE